MYFNKKTFAFSKQISSSYLSEYSSILTFMQCFDEKKNVQALFIVSKHTDKYVNMSHK